MLATITEEKNQAARTSTETSPAWWVFPLVVRGLLALGATGPTGPTGPTGAAARGAGRP